MYALVCMCASVCMCVDMYVAVRGQLAGAGGCWELNPVGRHGGSAFTHGAMQTLFNIFSLGEDALPNGLDVTFEVTELRRLTGSYNTMVGNNEGSMVGCDFHCCLEF